MEVSPLSEPVLKVENLRKEFGGLVAVKDVSFEVGPGEFIGLIGPNGCGKSTTFNCISGLLDQTAGNIEIFGKDASNMARPNPKPWIYPNLPAHSLMATNDRN